MKNLIPILGVISFFSVFIFATLTIWVYNPIFLKLCFTSFLVFTLCLYFKDYHNEA